MKKMLTLILCFMLCLTLIPAVSAQGDSSAAAMAATVNVPVTGDVSYSEAFAMLEIVNRERRSAGVSPLTMDRDMLDAAMLRAYETALDWNAEHVRPNGEMCYTINTRMTGENIAAADVDAEAVMKRWMQSGDHRRNLLKANHKSIGIGAVKVDGNYYWVQCFADDLVAAASKPADAPGSTRPIQVQCSSTFYKPLFKLSDATLSVGQSAALSVSWDNWTEVALPFSGITVESSAPSILQVNGNTVTAKENGTAQISVYYGDYSAGAQTFTVTCGSGGPLVTEPPAASQPVSNPGNTTTTGGGFSDVPSGAYYAEAVNWAVRHNPQITDGVDAKHFQPGAGCTRAQAVTFLWRANGCPEPRSTRNPFTDVASSKYYYKAVLWAVEQGITDGATASTFAPNGSCTRAQIVTFLWRAEGAPASGSRSAGFSDVQSGKYYANAVSWAVNRQITDGVDRTHFAPNASCTRAQIVTFLWRCMN